MIATNIYTKRYNSQSWETTTPAVKQLIKPSEQEADTITIIQLSPNLSDIETPDTTSFIVNLKSQNTTIITNPQLILTILNTEHETTWMRITRHVKQRHDHDKHPPTLSLFHSEAGSNTIEQINPKKSQRLQDNARFFARLDPYTKEGFTTANSIDLNETNLSEKQISAIITSTFTPIEEDRKTYGTK